MIPSFLRQFVRRLFGRSRSGNQTKQLGDDLTKAGQTLHTKADELTDLARKAPDQSRRLRGLGDFYCYLGSEAQRAAELGLTPGAEWTDEIDSVRDRFASDHFLGSVDDSIAVASGCLPTFTTDLLGFSTAVSQPFLEQPPRSFQELGKTDHLVSDLDSIKSGLGATWREALDAVETGDIKGAATKARTVVDEITWIPPYDDIKAEPWCRLDNKKDPTRACRLAWIKYGKELPDALRGEASNDETWKYLNANYDRLGKYVHKITHVSKPEAADFRAKLQAISDALEVYVHALRRGIR